MKQVTGRPTKYDPRYCEKVDSYLLSRNNDELPTVVGFAIYIGIAKSTLYLWEKDYPLFSDSLSKIVEAQENQLINDGIYGGKEVNATIVKLLLQNNHGMRERVETDMNLEGNVTIDMDELIGLRHARTQTTGSNSDTFKPRM